MYTTTEGIESENWLFIAATLSLLAMMLRDIFTACQVEAGAPHCMKATLIRAMLRQIPITIVLCQIRNLRQIRKLYLCSQYPARYPDKCSLA